MYQFDEEMTSAKAQAPNLGLDVHRLRIIAIVAPAAFVGVLVSVMVVIADDVPLALLMGIGVLVSAAAAALFSALVFELVERSEASLVRSNEQLAAFRVAAMSIAREYELSPLLQRFVDISRELTSARYGAMSVVDAEGRILQFITSGLTDEERERIGPPPVGRGLLGAIIHEGAIRIDDIARDPRSVGFPEHHPPMHSMLGVPVESRSGKLGNLYLTEKEGADGFTDADEQMVRTFAAHAALAIETSHLQDEARALAVLRERERIGMDLHDGIIQSIYAVELRLEGVEEDIETNREAAREGLAGAIDALNAVISDVRSYIFELRPARLSYDLSEDMMRIVEEFRAGTTATVVGDIAPALPPLTESQRLALLHIARDGLANAHRHARASRIEVSLHSGVNTVTLAITDDGEGFDVGAPRPDLHRGLPNMAERAAASGGTFAVQSESGKGTTVRVEMPIRITEEVKT